MRKNAFLRTPIKAAQQGGLANLSIVEQTYTPAPTPAQPALPAAPYAQSLIITFDKPASAVEIAPLWEGELVFLADNLAELPKSVAQVNRNAADKLSLTGDLILKSYEGLEVGFTENLPQIQPFPQNVRYSKVKLTEEFLFDTLAKLNFQFNQGGKVRTVLGKQFLNEAIYEFLHGRLSPLLKLGDVAAQDPVQWKLPVVTGDDAATTWQLAVTVSSVAKEVLSEHWFDAEPEYDTLDGEALVPVSLATQIHRWYHPHHPGHSVISVVGLYHLAKAAAFAADEPAAGPLRTLLTAPLPDDKIFRKITVDRPPIAGVEVSGYPRRTFPLYNLNWNYNNGATISMRLPFNGQLYLPLKDGTYKFWLSSRTLANVTSRDARLTTDQDVTGRYYLPMPEEEIEASLENGAGVNLYAYMQKYDSARAWKVYRTKVGQINRLAQQIGQRYQVGPLLPEAAREKFAALNWCVPSINPIDEDYSALYGFFREAAARHHISPEMLQATFIGESLIGPGGNLINNLRDNPPKRYDPQYPIWDSAQVLGLDDLMREATEFLIPDWVDPSFINNLTEHGEFFLEKRKLNGIDVVDVGKPARITGWEAAVEWMAGALQWRLSLALDYCAAHNIPITTEKQRRYLIYAHFNCGQTWPVHGQSFAEPVIASVLRHSDGWPVGTPRPDGNSTARFNALLRVSSAELIETLGVYR